VKRLYRSRQHRVLGGVAAGAAEYFGLDVTVMRLLFALMGVLMPQVIVAYILAWVIIPEAPAETSGQYRVWTSTQSEPYSETHRQETPVSSYGPVSDDQVPTAVPTVTLDPTSLSPERVPPAGRSADRSKQFFGYLLIGVGVVALLKNVVPRYVWRIPFRLIGDWWPVGIIALGLVLIFGALRGR
jgi:phage shock protein C